MATAWYDYDVYSDYPATSYHNTDVGTPTDTPLTAPLSGTITRDTYQPWGGQLTIHADDPSQIGGIPYYFLIHMDAINPALSEGQHVNQGDFLGYSGGQLDNSGLGDLPAGYTHHVTSPAHSTGPHLDIGVTDSPQGSMDTSQTWSDRLVNIARQLQIPFGTGQGSSNTSTADKQQWAIDLLAALGNTSPDQAQVQFVSGWEHAESGASGGAQNNPLNTTEVNTPGVVSAFNNFGSQGQYHVYNYDTYQHGIQAEAKDLQNGLYPDLLAALQTPGASSDAALGVTGGTPSAGVQQNLLTWGTSDWSTIYSNLGAGTEPINSTGGGTDCNKKCGSCWLPWNTPCCLACEGSGVVNTTGTSLLPSWLQSPPWQNKSFLNVLGRAGFMILGGAMIIGGGYIAIKSLGESTGVTEKVSEAKQSVTSKAKRAGEAVATEGASEAGRAASKAGSKGKSSKSKASGGSKLKKQPSQQSHQSVTTNRPDLVKINQKAA